MLKVNNNKIEVNSKYIIDNYSEDINFDKIINKIRKRKNKDGNINNKNEYYCNLLLNNINQALLPKLELY